jgi:serine/threonine protein kinase
MEGARPIEFRSGGQLSSTAQDQQLSHGACRPVSDYTRSCRIGEGTYGTVYRAVEKATGNVVALKKYALVHEHNLIHSPSRDLKP